MPRRARLMLPNVPVHVIQRGNNRQACFFVDDDYTAGSTCDTGQGGQAPSEEERGVNNCGLSPIHAIHENMVSQSTGLAASPRILLVANSAWYLRNFRSQLVHRLEGQGYEVILAATPDEDVTSDFFSTRRFLPLRLSRKGLNPFSELLALLRLARVVRAARPDAVLAWTPKANIYAAIAGRLLRVPVVPNVSGLGVVFIKGGLFARFVGALYGFAFARAPLVYFQNEEDRSAFVNAGRVEAAKAERLPGSGVDLQRFACRPLPEYKPFVFLFVGRLLADKGLRELVTAVRQLKGGGYEFVVRLAGFVDAGNPSGISQAELDQWVNEGVVEYMGSLIDVRPAVAAAHCVVLPSYREGVPKSLLEAAAMGRPIITTDAVGCRDTVVAGRNGLLCEPGSAQSLAGCMKRMLEMPAQALAEMGRAGRAHAEQHFSEEIVLDAYLRQCDALTGQKARAVDVAGCGRE